jgi:hypothetical protein
MQSFTQKKFYSFRADASALGGFLEEPFEKNIPTLAPVSLSAVGGFATARSEAFNLDQIVSCSSAYTRVSGREHEDGSVSILVASVVEDLNILEVVRARRIVAQVSISIPSEAGPLRYSSAGSGFEGLRLAGRDCVPNLSSALHQPEGGPGVHGSPRSWEDIQLPARKQADNLVGWFKGRGEDAGRWAMARHGWMMTSAPEQRAGGPVLCSLVNGFEDKERREDCGHIVEIPGFGRIFLAELLVSRHSVQLVGIRAELGCPVSGQIGVATSGGGGQGNRD